MTQISGPTDRRFRELRRRAQDFLAAGEKNVPDIPREDVKKLVHELDTYQIELELQNEDLRQAYIELENSRTKFSELYDFAPVTYLTVSDKGMIVEANLTAVEMLGVERRQLLGMPFSAFIAKDSQDSYYLCRKTVIETKSKKNCELLLQKQGDESFWGCCESVVVGEPEGDFCIRTIITDISEARENTRKLASTNEALQKEIEQHHIAKKQLEAYIQRQKVMNSLLALAIEDISLDDMLNRILDHIVAFPDMGLAPSGILFLKDKESESLILKAHINVPEKLLQECARREYGECLCRKAALWTQVIFATSLEGLHEIKHNGMFAHTNYCVPILTTAGELLGVFALFLDIEETRNQVVEETLVAASHVIAGGIERIRVKESLRHERDALEKRVEQRTQELQSAQKQCLHVKKLGAIGRLVASIAHEFNNPLQGILTVLNGVAKRATLEDEDALLVRSAIGECDRIRTLIRDLQDFNRPSPGVKELMDLGKAINLLILLCKNECKNRNIVVLTEYEEGTPPVMAITDQIQQVMLNLLKNAADACPEGGTISVRIWSTAHEVMVQIKDTGIGIQPENLSRIFEPFFTTKAEVKGSGLGLSTSYGIIKEHNGRMDVESEPGKGTSFTITLPLTGASDEA